MKKRSLCSAALVAVLAASTIGSTAVLAADATQLDATGTVTVEESTDTGDDKEKIPDPEKPGEIPTDKDKDKEDITQNENKGPLKIEKVSNYIFGNIQPQAKEIKSFARATKIMGEGTNPVIRGALVQFADTRAAEKSGYTITAELTQQFTEDLAGGAGTPKVLEGSSIDFKNGIIRPQNGNTNVAPTAAPGAFTLELNQSVDVLTVGSDQGKGRYTMEFGQSAEYDDTKEDEYKIIGSGVPDSAGKSVTLTVPMNTAANMKTGTYIAKVQWSAVAAP